MLLALIPHLADSLAEVRGVRKGVLRKARAETTEHTPKRV